MQLLIEGGGEPLLQIASSRLETGKRHLGGPAVTGTADVRPALRHPAQGDPDQGGKQSHHSDDNRVGTAADQEGHAPLEGGFSGLNKADIGPEILDALAVHRRAGRDIFQRGGPGLSGKNADPERIGPGRDIFSRSGTVIRIRDRRDDEVAVAAGDERILEGLAARSAGPVDGLGRLHVIDLEIRREIHFGSLQQGHIAFAGHRHEKRGRIVGLERIFAELGGKPEFAHASAKARRSAAGKRRHIHGVGPGDRPLADRPVLILEETVEDAATAPAGVFIHQTDQLRRLNSQAPGLLRNNGPRTDDRRVINIVPHLLAMEFDTARSIHFLAPEAVERGEFGSLESSQAGPLVLVEFEDGRDGLSKNGGSLAERESHKDIRSATGRRCLGIGLLLRLTPL